MLKISAFRLRIWYAISEKSQYGLGTTVHISQLFLRRTNLFNGYCNFPYDLSSVLLCPKSIILKLSCFFHELWVIGKGPPGLGHWSLVVAISNHHRSSLGVSAFQLFRVVGATKVCAFLFLVGYSRCERIGYSRCERINQGLRHTTLSSCRSILVRSKLFNAAA